MTMPSVMKTRSIWPVVAPMDLRIAMSFRFSITIMMSVLMMLNTATRMMNSRMMNITVFSSFRAENRLMFMSFQVLAQKPGPSEAITRSFTASAWYMSSTLTSMPEGLSFMNRPLAASSETYTMLLSYSYMPVEKTPLTTKDRDLGI